MMSAMESQITGVSIEIVYSAVCTAADQIKHQSYAPLAIVRGIHRWPVPSQTASNEENVSIGWRHYEIKFVNHLAAPWHTDISGK